AVLAHLGATRLAREARPSAAQEATRCRGDLPRCVLTAGAETAMASTLWSRRSRTRGIECAIQNRRRHITEQNTRKHEARRSNTGSAAKRVHCIVAIQVAPCSAVDSLNH